MVLGALLHDVGHLVGLRDGLAPMVTQGITLGTPRHEVVGGLVEQIRVRVELLSRQRGCFFFLITDGLLGQVKRSHLTAG